MPETIVRSVVSSRGIAGRGAAICAVSGAARTATASIAAAAEGRTVIVTSWVEGTMHPRGGRMAGERYPSNYHRVPDERGDEARQPLLDDRRGALPAGLEQQEMPVAPNLADLRAVPPGERAGDARHDEA